jgi:carboxylesterase type B
VYGNTCGIGNFTADEKRLSCEMGTYWAAFGRTGDPNAVRSGTSPCTHTHEEGAVSYSPVAWPAFNPEKANDMRLETPLPEVESSNADGLCAFWDSMGYHY